MNAELDLSVPEVMSVQQGKPGGGRGVIWMVLIIATATLVVAGIGLFGPAGAPRRGTGLDVEACKQLAMKLEKQCLYEAASVAWKEYIETAGLRGEDAARIWYRIGVIRQDAGEYEQALAGFYRSESYAKLSGLDFDIARRSQECLETMGKFAALRQELDERVGFGASGGAAGQNIVAEIGGRKISDTELDELIEKHIGRQLAQLSSFSFLPESELNARKEEMLKQFSAPQQRLNFLNQYIAAEVLYREARDSKLAEAPEMRGLLLDQERSLLASKVLERDVVSHIQITQDEIAEYYDGHKEDYAGKEEGEPASLDDVRGEIYQLLRGRKEQQLQQDLFRRLYDRHDVVIHQSAFGANEESAEQE